MSTAFKTVFLFSGQGSQYRGMGQVLFKQNAVFRETIEACHAIIKRQLHVSLVEELYYNKNTVWDDVLTTHPAIMAVEVAMYKVLHSMDIVPDMVCGTSLGEFAAAVANGAWTCEEALNNCIEQAKTIVRCNITGGMLAVIGRRRKDLDSLIARHGLFVASDNFEGHFTLAGSEENLANFQAAMEPSLAVQFLKLPVAVPFHSPLMNNAAATLTSQAESTAGFHPGRPGFISGLLCREINTFSPGYFWEVVSKYTDTIQLVDYLESRGPCLYIDLGPSGTSITFVKYNLGPPTRSVSFKIMSPYQTELQQLNRLLTYLNNAKSVS